MKNHLLVILLSLICNNFSSYAKDPSIFTRNNIVYKINPDGKTVTVKGVGGIDKYLFIMNTDRIVIPDSVTYDKKYCVTAIGNEAFDYTYNDNLRNITLPNTIIAIGDDAFRYCKSLRYINIPSSVTTIGARAFCLCSSLTEVTIPSSVTKISDGAFSNCKRLTKVILPNSLESIGKEAFSNCENLTYMSLPNSVKKIDDLAFFYCINLYSINIPDSVTEIGNEAFNGCINLRSVTIGYSVRTIGYNAFYGCESLASITIPYSVETIKSNAFSNCNNLRIIRIPNGTKERFNHIISYYIDSYYNISSVKLAKTLLEEYQPWNMPFDYRPFQRNKHSRNLQSEEKVKITPQLKTALSQYSKLHLLLNGFIVVEKDSMRGFVNTNGEEIVPCKYDEVHEFCDGMAAVSKENKWGFVNTHGEQVISCKYNSAGNFRDGMATVVKDNKWGFVNTLGEEVVSCKYDEVHEFYGGMAAVLKENKWGFVNSSGEEIVPCKYDEVGDFSEGLAAVAIGEYDQCEWGYVDNFGNIVIPISMAAKYACEFSQGRAFILSNNYLTHDDLRQCYCIDTHGKIIFKNDFKNLNLETFISSISVGNFDRTGYGFDNLDWSDKIKFFKYIDGKIFLPTYDDNIFVVYDLQGNCIEKTTHRPAFLPSNPLVITCGYNVTEFDDNGYRIFESNHKKGIRDLKGNIVVNAKYDYIDYVCIEEDIKMPLANNGLFSVYLAENGLWEDYEYQYHHGFADIYGNDTFTDEVKELVNNSYRISKNEYLQNHLKKKFKNILGTWQADFDKGASLTLIIDKNNITEILKTHQKTQSKTVKTYSFSSEENADRCPLYLLETNTSSYRIEENGIYGKDESIDDEFYSIEFKRVNNYSSNKKQGIAKTHDRKPTRRR